MGGGGNPTELCRRSRSACSNDFSRSSSRCEYNHSTRMVGTGGKYGGSTLFAAATSSFSLTA